MPIPTPALTDTGRGGEREIDYRDEPLDPFVQDNIEIDCIIGQGPISGDTQLPENGRPYFVTELEIHLTEGSSSNYAIGQVVPDGHDFAPSEGNPLEEGNDPDIIAIDIDNELMEERPGTNGEITRVFTGIISNASRVTKGLFEFMAFWPGYNEIQNGSLTIATPNPRKEVLDSVTDGGTKVFRTDYTTRWQYADYIADTIGSYVTADTPFNYTINLTDAGTPIEGTLAGRNLKMTIESESEPITADGKSEGLLQRVIKATNSVWDIDRYGDFHIGPPVPDGDIETSVTSHKLRYITDTSAGKQSPAWASIVVIGDGVVSKDGWSASAQINNTPSKLSSPITEELAPDEVTSKLAQPVFEYTNLEINTAEEAENVLEKLRDEIKKQSAGGEITVVGHPEVWPGDAVELPDTKDQPFASERYAVGEVIHRVNNEDGFLTKIKVMGQTNAAKSVFSNEIPESVQTPDRYDTNFTQEELERVKSGQQGL